MTLSVELISEWIYAFPITAHVSHHLDVISCDDQPEKSEWKYHKEELKHRRVLDAHDQELMIICAKVEKHLHPLEDVRPCLYNPITSQIAPAEVNVYLADSIEIGAKMERKYIVILPNRFYNLISSHIKTMSLLKNQIK